MLTMLFISLFSVTSQVCDTLLQASTVTALKESISTDRLPSPVTVLREDDLHVNNIYRHANLSGQVPGLYIPEYGASLTSTIYIRGLGSRMENPVMGLYLDGVPVLDKNAYDFDWEGIRSAVVMRGPQGTLYGRNAMGGVLALQSFSPSDETHRSIHLEYGSANYLRVGGTYSIGRHVLAAQYRHGDGFFRNEYKGSNCDPYDGLSLHWKWERNVSERLLVGNTFWASFSSEGGFAYGRYLEGKQMPVSYNDEGSYRRASVVEGLYALLRADKFTADAVASVQLLSDNMHMDQDYTAEPIFTLQQRQHSGAGTFELRISRADAYSPWQPKTGFFALYKLNHLEAPVIFKHDGIQKLILDNANSHIPENIGYLVIPDSSFPVSSDFHIHTWNAALFHESVLTLGRWQFTAGLRLDYEGARMNYDCLASLHYRFVPTMASEKPFSMPYKGRQDHGYLELLPKFSVLYSPNENWALYSNITKGYRAGGFNTQIFSDILQNLTMYGMMKDLGVYLDGRPGTGVSAENTEYDPESAWNFEAGARLHRGNLRAEISAYYIRVSQQQLTVFPPGMSTGRMMANAARSRSFGTEAELDWTPGNLRTHVSWSWCDSRFVSYDDGNSDYSGRFIPYVPRQTIYMNVGYSFPLDGNRLDLDFSVRGAGSLYWNENNTLREPLRLRPEARIALVFPRWEIYLRAENLTGTQGHSFYFKSMGNEFFALGKPRTIMTGISIKL